jgi:sugar phosphate isomerase/epimerase
MAYDVGVQTYTYREFTVEEIVEELADLPVDVVEVTGTHLDLGDHERAREVRDLFGGIGAEVVGWSAPSPDDPDHAREVIGFAAEHGIEYLNVSFDPDDDATIDAAAAAGEERDVMLGLHNHGPDEWSPYASYEDVLAVCEGRPHAVGACLDTGHYFRVDETPAEVVPALGERIHAVHVKDFLDAEREVVPGDGNLDVAELIELLDEHVSTDPPLVVEYEEDPGDPTPAVATALDRLEDAVGR